MKTLLLLLAIVAGTAAQQTFGQQPLKTVDLGCGKTRIGSHTSQTAQTPEAAEAFAKRPLPRKFRTTKELADYLACPFQNNELKTRSIYYWIVANITYDQRVYQDRKLVTVKPQEIIVCKTTVCEGYARLFMDMCSHVGIQTQYVVGHAKWNPRFRPGDTHAWCLVKLDSKWQIVEPTWGSVNDARFYFAPDPELFKYTHFAFDRAQQLALYPLSRAEFDGQDGICGSPDLFWREWHNRIDAGELKPFKLDLDKD